MVKKAYSVETKLACIEMKKAGKPNKVIMETLGIKNVSQVKTWWRWYRNDELHRFHQPVGKQYTYGKEWHSYLKWNNYAYRWNC